MSSPVPMAKSTMLYDYPAWDYNVYGEPEMTMELGEPATTPWAHANADPGYDFEGWFAE